MHLEEYRVFRCNHVLHGLTALYKLGANTTRLEEFYNEHVKNKEPAQPSEGRVNKDNWCLWLGKKTHFLDYTDFFEKEINSTSVSHTLIEYLPHLMPAMPTAALHPVIQLGYALEAGSVRGIASGLAYFCYAYEDFGVVCDKRKSPSVPLADILSRIHSDHTFDHQIEKRKEGFQTFLRHLHKEFYNPIIAYAELWDVDTGKDGSGLMNQQKLIQDSLIDLFHLSGDNDFFLLHGITGAHALKYVLKHIDTASTEREKVLSLKRSLLRQFVLAVIYVYIAEGRPSLKPLPGTTLPHYNTSWSDAITQAIQHEDVHLIKLVAACKEAADEDTTGSDRYLQTVAGILSQIPTSEGYEFRGSGWSQS